MQWRGTSWILGLFVLAAATAPALAINNPVITYAGPPETVLTFGDASGCGAPGVPDLPDTRAYAYRRADGQTVLLTSNSQNFLIAGDSLDHVGRIGCAHVFDPPPPDADPARFHGRMWLKAAIRLASGDWLAFIHNEYHGELFVKDACGSATSGAGLSCWYASSLIAVSKDGGQTFVLPKTPGQVLATLPFKFEPGQGRVSYGTPYPVSHLEKSKDGDAYVFFSVGGNRKNNLPITRSGRNGTCVMKGPGADVGKWRMWSGSDFDTAVENPYVGPPADPKVHTCEPVVHFDLGAVKYIPAQQLYLALGSRGTNIVYATSRDLVTWSKPAILDQFVPAGRWHDGLKMPTAYFSLLDPTSPSPSYETLEGRPYMYYVEFFEAKNGKLVNRSRRLMRVPLAIRF